MTDKPQCWGWRERLAGLALRSTAFCLVFVFMLMIGGPNLLIVSKLESFPEKWRMLVAFFPIVWTLVIGGLLLWFAVRRRVLLERILIWVYEHISKRQFPNP